MKLLFLLAFFGLLTFLEASTVSGIWERLHREPPVRGDPTKGGVPRATFETKWIRQKVDNFNPQNPSTWNMRYLENREHYLPGSPLFIFVGGEWTIGPDFVIQGHFYDMAVENRAYLLYTEHRYYGQSRPTANTRTDQLRFLSVDQALADLAHFVEEMRATIPGAENAKVIIAGASYSAMLVTYFRQKYPHLVDGVWASSGPLYNKVDYDEYNELMSESIRLVGGNACADRIQRGYAEMEELIEQGDYDKLIQEFNLCADTDLSKTMDAHLFFNSITGNFAGLVQHHFPGDIEGMCEVINDPKYPTATAAIAAWFSSFSPGCFDASYENSIIFSRSTDWNHPANILVRPWFHQSCAELGWFQTTGSENQIFGSGVPVDFFYQLCLDLYDSKFNNVLMHAGVDRTNTIYGRLNPEVTNVVFTHGQLDPWRPAGVQQDLNEHSPVVIIPMASHIADLHSISEADSTEMRAAKERVSELIRSWVA